MTGTIQNSVQATGGKEHIESAFKGCMGVESPGLPASAFNLLSLDYVLLQRQRHGQFATLGFRSFRENMWGLALPHPLQL